MIAVGIDVGSRYVKTVAIDDSNVKGYGCIPIMGDLKYSVKKSIKEAMSSLHKKPFEKVVYKMTGTGCAGKNLYPYISPAQCLSRSIPTGNTRNSLIINAGAMSVEGIIVSHKGKIIETGKNQRCNAGGGRFLEIMSSALGITFSDIDPLVAASTNPYSISSGCIVFAESEVITQVNSGQKLEDIVAGMVTLVTGKIATIYKQIIDDEIEHVYLTGGLSEFASVSKELTRLTGREITEFQVDPIYASAYGAALTARN